MTTGWETGRFAQVDDTHDVDSAEAAVRIVEQMHADLLAHPGEWENHTLERFLESLAAVVETLPARYGENGSLPTPTWQIFAEALVIATGYE